MTFDKLKKFFYLTCCQLDNLTIWLFLQVWLFDYLSKFDKLRNMTNWSRQFLAIWQFSKLANSQIGKLATCQVKQIINIVLNKFDKNLTSWQFDKLPICRFDKIWQNLTKFDKIWQFDKIYWQFDKLSNLTNWQFAKLSNWQNCQSFFWPISTKSCQLSNYQIGNCFTFSNKNWLFFSDQFANLISVTNFFTFVKLKVDK